MINKESIDTKRNKFFPNESHPSPQFSIIFTRFLADHFSPKFDLSFVYSIAIPQIKFR